MASIERTAYPRFKKIFTDNELELIFKPSIEEQNFVNKETRKTYHNLTLMTLLKCQQYLGYIPPINIIPNQIQDYIREQLGLLSVVELLEETELNKKTFFLFRQCIRAYLNIKPSLHDRKVRIVINRRIGEERESKEVFREKRIPNNIRKPLKSNFENTFSSIT